VAMEAFDGKGKVWLEGEAWSATTKRPVEKDQAVMVNDLDGLVLRVEPLAESESSGAKLQT